MGPLFAFLGFLACALLAGGAAISASAVLAALMISARDLAEGTMEPGAGMMLVVFMVLLGALGWLGFLGARRCRRRFLRLRPMSAPSGDQPFATVGRRMWAIGVDSLLLLPILGLSQFLPTASFGIFVAINLSYVLFQAYCVIMLAWRGQTLGKMALKVRVVRLDGSPARTPAILLRSSMDMAWSLLFTVQAFLAWRHLDVSSLPGMSYRDLENAIYEATPGQGVLLSLLFLWFASDYLSMLFTARRRALHDFLGGTVVVSTENPKPEVPARAETPLQGSVP